MADGIDVNAKNEFLDRLDKLPAKKRDLEIASLVWDALCKDGFSKKGTLVSSATVSAIVIGIIEAIKYLFWRT